MKIWIKYTIAIIVGIVFASFVPIKPAVLDVILELTINLCRYALVPLLFVSIPVAVFELHEDRKLLRLSIRLIAYSILAVFILTLVGMAGAFTLSPGRIPLSSDLVYNAGILPSFSSVLKSIVPANPLLSVLNGDYLLPLAAFCIVFGLAFSFDKHATRSTVSLFDSLSRVFWQINSFLMELLPVPLIFASACRMASILQVNQLVLYGRLILVSGIEVLFVVLILLPFVIFLFNKRKNPFPVIYGLLGAGLAALGTGHLYAPGPVLAKHLKENLGIRRRGTSLSMPLVWAFGRAGTAMISASTFIVIIKSYNDLGLDSGTLLWMLLWVPFATFLAGALPSAGAASILTFLCAAYGRGFETGYILVLPAAIPLLAFGAFLDTIIAGSIINISAKSEGYVTPRDYRHFI